MSHISSIITTTTTTSTSYTALSSLNTNETEFSLKNEYDDINMKSSIAAISDLTPKKKELKLHRERILFVVDRTISQLQISICLSRLLRRNACMLRRYLTPQELDFVQNVCMKYTETNKQEINLKKSPLVETLPTIVKISLNETKRMVVGKFSFPETDVDHLADPCMRQVMDILWNKSDLRKKILQEFELIPENDITLLVNYLRNLRKIIEIKLTTTAEEDKIREKRLRKSWLRKSSIDEKVEEYRVLIEQQRDNLGTMLKNKNDFIAKYLNKTKELKFNFKEQLRRRAMDSEREMAEVSVESQARQEQLVVQANLVTQQYENLLTRNMAAEKLLRSRRTKIETQLYNWLVKYDADIGTRNEEYETLIEGCDKKRAGMKEVQDLLNEQEEEYTMLFEQKAEEDQQEWEERAFRFLMNRSVRKIQRCWRAYRQRKIERKKAKKAKAKEKKQKSAETKSKGKSEAKPKLGAKEKSSADKKKAGTKKGKTNSNRITSQDSSTKSKSKHVPYRQEKKRPEQGARSADPMSTLGKKFGGGVFDELQGDDFTPASEPVDLMAD